MWSSPNYFMDVKKGASEDHAILQCNLFLGMGLDAYLAIGRSDPNPNPNPNPKRKRKPKPNPKPKPKPNPNPGYPAGSRSTCGW